MTLEWSQLVVTGEPPIKSGDSLTESSTMAEAGGDLYVFETSETSPAADSKGKLFRFSMKTMKWTKLDLLLVSGTPPSAGRGQASMTAVAGDLFVFGGSTEGEIKCCLHMVMGDLT